MTVPNPATLFAPGSRTVRIGELAVPSGHLLACDPFLCKSAWHFARAVPPGHYAVELRLIDSPDMGVRVAAARVILDPERLVRACEPAEISGVETNAYSVDSGLGCFMDQEARDDFVAAMTGHQSSHPDGNYYADILSAEFAASATASPGVSAAGLWAMHSVPPMSLTIAMFSSGLGDGSYGSYWALDASGHAAFLFTDFGLLQREHDAT